MGYVNEANYVTLPEGVTIDHPEVVQTRKWTFTTVRSPKWLMLAIGQVSLGWQIQNALITEQYCGLRRQWVCEVTWVQNSDKATMVAPTGLETIQMHPKVSWWNCLKLAWICVFSKRSEKVTEVKWVIRNTQGGVVG